MPVLETDFDLGDIGGIDVDSPGDIAPPPDAPEPGDHPPQIEPWDRSVRFIIRTTKPVRPSDLQADIQGLFTATPLGFFEVLGQVMKRLQSLFSFSNTQPASLTPKKTLSNQITVERLFKGPYAPHSIMNRYYVLILPTTYRHLKRMARGRDGLFYDVAYKLRVHPLIEAIEPDLPLQRSVEPLSSVSSMPLCGNDISDLDDPAWARVSIRHTDLLSAHPALLGTGSVIGHLDTGYQDHSELNHDDTYLRDSNSNFIEVNVVEGEHPDDAYDRQSPGLCFGSSSASSASVMADSPHGTATASTMCSLDDSAGDEFNLLGIASGAKILPVRCLMESCRVVSLWNSDIARAFEHAINLNYTRAGQEFTPIEEDDNDAERSHVDVISASFGGYMIDAVWDAIMEAVRKNIIVVAAAGNYVDWVVEPAAFPHVIAVGGTTPDDEPWNGSGMGPEVDLSAPALCVVHAAFDTDGSETVIAGAGTSHSAPAVASAAALWLQHHGIDALKTRFADTPLQFVFQCVLRLTARVPDEWNPDYGAGILDVLALIDFDLNDDLLTDCLDVVPRNAENTFDPTGYARPTTWNRLARIFGFASEKEIRAALQTLIKSAQMEIETFVDDFGAELVHFFSEAEEARELMVAMLEATHQGNHTGQAIAANTVIDEGIKVLSTALVQAANWVT